MRVSVQRELCVAGGHCVLQAPGVFDQDDDDGRVLLLNPEPSPEKDESVRIAAQICPAAAITITG
jgi:ferredoxin